MAETSDPIDPGFGAVYSGQLKPVERSKKEKDQHQGQFSKALRERLQEEQDEKGDWDARDQVDISDDHRADQSDQKDNEGGTASADDSAEEEATDTGTDAGEDERHVDIEA